MRTTSHDILIDTTLVSNTFNGDNKNIFYSDDLKKQYIASLIHDVQKCFSC